MFIPEAKAKSDTQKLGDKKLVTFHRGLHLGGRGSTANEVKILPMVSIWALLMVMMWPRPGKTVRGKTPAAKGGVSEEGITHVLQGRWVG